MKKETEAREGNVFQLCSCHGRSRPHAVLTPVGSQPSITLLSWALERPSPYTTRLQAQAEEKAPVDSPPLSTRQERGPQGKHLCQGQGARPRLGKPGLVEAAVLLPVPGWASPHPTLTPPGPAGRCLVGQGGRKAGEAGGLSELLRGNFVGKGDKEGTSKGVPGCMERSRWIKFSSSWERR